MIEGFGDMGASLSLAAIGSALGTGIAGMAAIGAWKKCFAQSKTASFLLVAFVGAPLSQTFYGMILKVQIVAANLSPESYKWQLLYGLLGGIAMGVSAWMQGKAGASAADAYAETGEGFVKYFMVLGVIESVALLTMIFLLRAIPSVAA